MSYILESWAMKTVSARETNQTFSDLLSQGESGEEVLITKRGQPVAVLSPYRPSAMTPERRNAIDHAIKVMQQGLRWAGGFRTFDPEAAISVDSIQSVLDAWRAVLPIRSSNGADLSAV